MLDEWNTFHGWCLARGIKPLKLAYPELLDLALHWMTDGATAESLADFERQLTLPPPNTEIRKDDPIWGRDAEMAMFSKAKRKPGPQ